MSARADVTDGVRGTPEPGPSKHASDPPPVFEAGQPPEAERRQANLDPLALDERLPVPRRLSRWLKWLWALTVLAAAALAAAATFALTWMAPVSVSSGAVQIATLEPSATAEVPSNWFGAGPSSVVYEYYGLTLFETATGFSGPGTDCFTVVVTEQVPDEEEGDPNNWSLSGLVSSGCRVGDFPATIELLVDANAPEELSARYPKGSALQFVLDGDRVGVFLDQDNDIR